MSKMVLKPFCDETLHMSSQCIVLVNSEQKTLMGFVFIEFYDSKSPMNCFVRNHQYFEIFAPPPPKKRDAPENFYQSFMYIAPSSDCSLLTPNLPFKVILRKFEVVSRGLKVIIMHISKD